MTAYSVYMNRFIKIINECCLIGMLLIRPLLLPMPCWTCWSVKVSWKSRKEGFVCGNSTRCVSANVIVMKPHPTSTIGLLNTIRCFISTFQKCFSFLIKINASLNRSVMVYRIKNGTGKRWIQTQVGCVCYIYGSVTLSKIPRQIKVHCLLNTIKSLSNQAAFYWLIGGEFAWPT